MKRRDLVREIERLGYTLDRSSDHGIFEKDGCRPLQIPNHREINEQTAKEILKIAKGD
ncbi:MAG: type II toxin-antitoxin system HicA family toxin [Clostridiales bacterium]|nr:type II toxin-antitoxin system HicA family toxin [Clostridiales bacterium]